jgi:hypothetical protein
MHKYALSIFLIGSLTTLYYAVSIYFGYGTLLDSLFYAAFDIGLAYLFGLIIFGLLGILFSMFFFYVHHLMTGKMEKKNKYVIIKTHFKMSPWFLVKRAFLLYCIAISLTLTTIQLIDALNFPGLFDDTQMELYVVQFELYYLILVLVYSVAISVILVPTWFYDDVNLMYFAESEGVRYIYPFGNSVLPALKGFGGPSIILSYLVFALTKLGTTAPLTLLFDPVLTLFMPITYMMGFETISVLGKKLLKSWLMKKGIKEYTTMSINLDEQCPPGEQVPERKPDK